MVSNGNQIQYLLCGSVPSSNLKYLLHRLRGLCDNAAVSDNSFEEHESVYIMKNATTNSGSVTLHVRRSRDNIHAPYQIRYLGSPEGLDGRRAATMRTCIDVTASSNASEFLEKMGFQFDYETILKGYIFRRGLMKITVSRLHKIPEKGVFSNALPMTDSYLVELTLNTHVQQDSLCDDMKAFAENLKPLVILDKLEVKR